MEVAGKTTDLSEEEITCLPCSLEGSTEPAYGYCQDCEEHLCETCFKHHKRSRPSRNHVLLDKEDMPLQQTFANVKSDDETDVCPKHTDKRLEFYCRRHEKAACYVCVTLRHKTCEVDYIPDISGNITESDELRNLTDLFRTLKEKCETSILKTTTTKDKIELDQANILKEMKLLRKEINECLDKMEAELKGKLEVLATTLGNRLTATHDECEDIGTKVNDLERKFNSLIENNQKNRLFIEMKKAEKSLAVLEDSEKQTRENNETHCDIVFVRNNKLVELLTAEALGVIVSRDATKCLKDEETNKERSTTPAEDKIVNLEFSGTLDVKSPSDKNACSISGMTLLPPRNIAVADYANKCVKVLDKDSNSLISELHLFSGPRDIISLPQNKLAVAQCDEKLIQILSVTDTAKFHLSVDRRLDIGEKCYALAYCEGKLVVGCDFNPGKVLLLDLAGNILNSFGLPGLFAGPENIVVSRDKKNLFISDYYSLSEKCVRMDWEGNTLDTFVSQNKSRPIGLQELDDGTILVCYMNANTIVRLSRNLKECKIDGLNETILIKPRAIAYCKTEQKLFVSCAYEKELFKPQDTIQMFNLKWR